MIIELVIFIAFIFVAAGDCYSTAKILRFNHKLLHDKNFSRRVRYKTTKKLKEDEAKAEMSSFGRHFIQKYGGDRAMLYGFLLGYSPISVFLFYVMLTDEFSMIGAVFLLGVMVGVLYRQIWKALHMKKEFGVDIWKTE